MNGRGFINCVVTLVLVSALCAGQSKVPAQSAGVDQTKMGPFRALAQLTLAAFEKGNVSCAAELAKILERTWDDGEGGFGGELSLRRVNRESYDRVDHAMDLFVKPLIHYDMKSSDPEAVRRAYADYLDKLKTVDSLDTRQYD